MASKIKANRDTNFTSVMAFICCFSGVSYMLYTLLVAVEQLVEDDPAYWTKLNMTLAILAGFITSYPAARATRQQNLRNQDDNTQTLASVVADEEAGEKNSLMARPILTSQEKLDLCGYAIECIMSYSGAAYIVTSNIPALQTPFWTLILAISWSVLAAFPSVANVRSCKQAILELRGATAPSETKEDYWDHINFIGEFLSALISEAAWSANVFTDIIDCLREVFSSIHFCQNFIWNLFCEELFIPAILVGLYSAVGSAICHLRTNVEGSKTKDPKIEARLSTRSLPCHYQFFLGGDWLGHTGEYASAASLLISMACDYVGAPSYVSLIFQCCLLEVARRGSRGDVQTCRQNLKRYLIGKELDTNADSQDIAPRAMQNGFGGRT